MIKISKICLKCDTFIYSDDADTCPDCKGKLSKINAIDYCSILDGATL